MGNVLVHSVFSKLPLKDQTADANAVAAEILKSKTAYVDGEKVTGTMTNNNTINDLGGVSSSKSSIPIRMTTDSVAEIAMTTDSGNILLSITPPAGYYDGTTKIGISALTLGDVSTSNVLSGETFTSGNGVALTGTMTNRGAVTKSLVSGGSYIIPAGYHNGRGKVTASNMPQASKILYGRIYQIYLNANLSSNYANCNAGDEVWITATAVDVSSSSAASSKQINLKNYNIVGFMTIIDSHKVAPSYYDSSKFELTSTGHLHFTSETTLRSYSSSTGTRLIIFYD